MRPRCRTFGAVAAIAAAALFAISAPPAVGQQKLTPVRIAYVPVATWLPAWVAKDTGIFAKHGLDVSMTPVQNLSLLPGTVGRQFEFAASTPPDLIKAAAGGVDVVGVAGEAIETKDNQAMAVIVRKDSGITGPKDLKGKAIAAPTLGAVMHVATLYWLKKSGVDPN
jgi:ABC-type nitrate/sulfonate/bicarbonate transport system substrate-binding protein